MNARGETSDDVAPVSDRRTIRRQQAKDEIVGAAWDLVREQGLAGLAMRDLGERVGMRAQSIYSYFGSKHEIYDAMFHEGYVAFAATMADLDDGPPEEPESTDASGAAARRAAHRFFGFCTSDPARYQLLFQRNIPGFEPSAESYAVAVKTYEATVARLARIGVDTPEAVDLWTAALTGLTDQQISNDPGGDRWERLIDRTINMLLAEIVCSPIEPTSDRS